jgi:hypothetical protein
MKKVVKARMEAFGQAGHAGDYEPISLEEMVRRYKEEGTCSRRPKGCRLLAGRSVACHVQPDKRSKLGYAQSSVMDQGLGASSVSRSMRAAMAAISHDAMRET